MKEKLIKILKNSYSPYSKFSVAAAAVLKDGNIVYGVNVENASYGLALCAERNAITTAITDGYKKGDFDKLYVMLGNEKIGYPCGACRQVILKFFDVDSEIISIDKLGNEEIHTVEELCPFSFTVEDL